MIALGVSRQTSNPAWPSARRTVQAQYKSSWSFLPREDRVYHFFFFQAEDGIRDLTVTGVQTCALPISAICNPKCMAPLTMKSDLSPRRRTWRTFRSPGALISVAAPDMLSALRTSCTEAEEMANNCPLTRKRTICSVLAGVVFAGAANRISELPRALCGRFRGRAFRWRGKYRRWRAPDRRHRF